MDPIDWINSQLAASKAETIRQRTSPSHPLAGIQSEINDAVLPDKLPSYSDVLKYVGDFLSYPALPTSLDSPSKLTSVLHTLLPGFTPSVESAKLAVSLFDANPGHHDPETIRRALIGDILPSVSFKVKPSGVAKSTGQMVRPTPETKVVEGSIRYLDDIAPRTARDYIAKRHYRSSLHRDYPVPSVSAVGRSLPAPGRLAVPTPSGLAVSTPLPGFLPVIVSGSGLGSPSTDSIGKRARPEPSGDVPSSQLDANAGTESNGPGFGGSANRWNCDKVIIMAMKQPNPAQFIMNFHPECMQEFIASLAKGY